MEKNINLPTLRENVVFLVRQTRAMAGFTRAEMGSFLGLNGELVRNWERGLTVPRADAFLAVMELRRRILRAKRNRTDRADGGIVGNGTENRLCETVAEISKVGRLVKSKNVADVELVLDEGNI
jgi:DNA-binding XRE family transcriptional regulator